MSAVDWPLERDLERSLAAARATRERIAPFVRRTPLVEADPLGPAERATRLLKLETLQRTGSFKIRGAAAAITAAPRPPAEVIAASTGNHGLAVAAVARELGLPARVFVPADAAPAKLARLRRAGIEPLTVDGDPLECELEARAVAQRTGGALFVSPYNDAGVVLGQSTLGLELAEQAEPPPETVFVAVGGGGLAGGVALVLRSLWPHTRIVGCSPAASPAMADAISAGRVVTSRMLPTLADATAGNIEPGAVTVPLCAALLDEIVLLEEREIAGAIRVAARELHLVIEGAAALALAASRRETAPGRQVVILSGAGIGARALDAILAAGADETTIGGADVA